MNWSPFRGWAAGAAASASRTAAGSACWAAGAGRQVALQHMGAAGWPEHGAAAMQASNPLPRKPGRPSWPRHSWLAPSHSSAAAPSPRLPPPKAHLRGGLLGRRLSRGHIQGVAAAQPHHLRGDRGGRGTFEWQVGAPRGGAAPAAAALGGRRRPTSQAGREPRPLEQLMGACRGGTCACRAHSNIKPGRTCASSSPAASMSAAPRRPPAAPSAPAGGCSRAGGSRPCTRAGVCCSIFCSDSRNSCSRARGAGMEAWGGG